MEATKLSGIAALSGVVTKGEDGGSVGKFCARRGGVEIWPSDVEDMVRVVALHVMSSQDAESSCKE